MRCFTSEDLDVEQMGSMLRELYEMDGLDFLIALLFQFPYHPSHNLHTL